MTNQINVTIQKPVIDANITHPNIVTQIIKNDINVSTEQPVIDVELVKQEIVVQFPGTQGVPGVSANELSEEPSGVINGTNTYFTLSNTPTINSEKVYLNGLRLKRKDDYTIASNVISIIVPPISGDIITVDYNI